jgi:hypothetical protein
MAASFHLCAMLTQTPPLRAKLVHPSKLHFLYAFTIGWDFLATDFFFDPCNFF